MRNVDISFRKIKAILSNLIYNFTGLNAASLSTAQSYIQAFQNMATKNNTLILPANVSDVTGIVGSAVTAYKTLSKTLLTLSDKEPESDSKLENEENAVGKP